MFQSYGFLLIYFLLLLPVQSLFAGRYYDSKTGRWLSVDPIAGKYPEWSSYNYALNNPLRNIDPDGKEPITLTTTGLAVAGAVTIAVVGHTYNYWTNSSYQKSYDSFTESVIDVSGEAIDNVWNTVTNLLSSEENTGNSNSDENNESGRGTNKLKPDPKAEGDHSTIKTGKDGNITNIVEWEKNPKNPSGFDEKKRTDVKGDSHYNKKTKQDVPTPHVHEKNDPGGVRPAREDELPKQR